MNRIKNVLTSTNLFARITRIFLLCIFALLLYYSITLLLSPVRVFAADSDLIINEIMYDAQGTDEGHEWVEVKNGGSTPITITDDWRFWDGANHLFNLYQGLATIQTGGFAVLTDDPVTFLADYPGFSGTIFKVAMSLNNDGDTLKLSKDDGATYFSEISYSKNLGAAGNRHSLERDLTIGGATSDNWRESFIMSGTPGRENSTLADRPQYSRQVYINEILPYPSSGSENEFIEFYNSGDSAVDLSGWKLDDVINGGASAYEIEQGTTIAPHGYLIFYKSKTKLTLNDDGDEVNLINPIGERVCSIPYPVAKKSESYIRLPEGFWRWTIVSTPLSENILKLPSSAGFATSFDDLRVISAKTGEMSGYEGRKVEIVGKVVETSGNTFYLDDGTGKVKCYIQAKAHIDKPKMYKGYKVRVAGTVDLYRGVWRILPQYQEDVEILESSKNKTQPASPAGGSAKQETVGKTAEKIGEKTGIDEAYAASEAGLLLKEITKSGGKVKSSKTSGLFNKIILAVIIIAGILLLFLIGDFLWRKRLSLMVPRKPENLPKDLPENSKSDKW